MDRRMDKEGVVYIYNGISLSREKEWNLAICNNLGGARVYYAKQNKSARERQTPYDIIHTWNLRNETNEQRGRKERQTKKQTPNYGEQTDGHQRGGGWGEGEVG